jgi:hypothetical protein
MAKGRPVDAREYSLPLGHDYRQDEIQDAVPICLSDPVVNSNAKVEALWAAGKSDDSIISWGGIQGRRFGTWDTGSLSLFGRSGAAV